MKDWGYYLLSQSHRDSPGYTGLLVVIRKQPTGKHFDSETLHLRIRDIEGVARRRTLSWLSAPPDSDRVCPGRVILRDRFDKSVEFFTFGGSLEVISRPGEIVYSLRSPAPILELTAQSETVPDQLASETELLIGELQVRWRLDEEGFDRRLGEVDPLRFYLATLRSILLHYERAQPLGKVYHEFYDALLQEKAWFVAEGLWPANLPLLEDLLAPD